MVGCGAVVRIEVKALAPGMGCPGPDTRRGVVDFGPCPALWPPIVGLVLETVAVAAGGGMGEGAEGYGREVAANGILRGSRDIDIIVRPWRQGVDMKGCHPRREGDAMTRAVCEPRRTPFELSAVMDTAEGIPHERGGVGGDAAHPAACGSGFSDDEVVDPQSTR